MCDEYNRCEKTSNVLFQTLESFALNIEWFCLKPWKVFQKPLEGVG